MRTRQLLLLAFLTISATASMAKPQLTFKEGTGFHVQIDEMLRITQQYSQVDSALVEPSFRFTTYHYSEMIEKVNLDGSALIAATLDSLTTKIYLGKVTDRQEYFRFNSNNEYDISNRLRDIRALPRAQFLGQTLRYVIGNDGVIKYYQNLDVFQQSIIARSYEYDMFHALMSFTDSLRIGQNFEQGGGALAALAMGGKQTQPFTIAEIHVNKVLSATSSGDKIEYTATFANQPKNTEYLEGIAFPMNIEHFNGGLQGKCELKQGVMVSASETDSAKMDLVVENEIIKNAIYRTVSLSRKPIAFVRGVEMQIKDMKQHRPDPMSRDSLQTIPLTPPVKH